MGATNYGGKGFKERARVSGERPIGATSCGATRGFTPTPLPPVHMHSNPPPPPPNHHHMPNATFVLPYG